MIKGRNPLLDSEFLKKLDLERNRTTYARVTSLTNDSYPIERIEGVVTAGSINIDSKSAVRRVCNLTLTTDKLNINNIYWGLSTRVKIDIGLENKINANYDKIIWFPQGVYVLNSFKTSSQTNRYQISLSGKDKMCLLNGDVGGEFNAETQLDAEYVEQEDGTWVNEKKPIAYIIREMIHHYAQESFHNIIVKDIDTLSLKVLNNQKTTFYLIKEKGTDRIVDYFYEDAMANNYSDYLYYNYPGVRVNFSNFIDGFIFDSYIDEDNSSLIANELNLEPWLIYKDDKKYTVIKINNGDDIGYQLTETYYPDELIAGVGETVTSILDKIIKTFGEFEYFYNLDGQFVFQAKETYVNTSWNSMITNENEYYVAPAMVSSKVKYNFEGSEMTTAYENTPNIGNIKNDFTIWGIKKTASGLEIPIHMRYAIDQKPEFYRNYNKEIFVSKNFINKYYKINNPENIFTVSDSNNNVLIQYNVVDWREIIYQMQIDYYQHNHDDDFEVRIYQNNKDTYLNLQYYERGKTGYEQYYHDIEGFWRLLYAPQEYVDNFKPAFKSEHNLDKNDFYDGKTFIGPWNKKILEDPSQLIFWFDFFEAESFGIGQFSIPAIGDRPKNKSNDKVRALIYKDIPDVVLVSQKDYDNYAKSGRLLTGYNYLITDDFIESCLEKDTITISTRGITAQEQIDDLLYNHAYCNETINITSVPIFYLEPNTIISAKDEQRTVNGYYIINKITLPLDYKGTMKITAIKVPERVY